MQSFINIPSGKLTYSNGTSTICICVFPLGKGWFPAIAMLVYWIFTIKNPTNRKKKSLLEKNTIKKPFPTEKKVAHRGNMGFGGIFDRRGVFLLLSGQIRNLGMQHLWLSLSWWYPSLACAWKPRNIRHFHLSRHKKPEGGTSRKCSIVLYPIGSMYGIFTYIWPKYMVNVGKYTINTWILWVLKEDIVNLIVNLILHLWHIYEESWSYRTSSTCFFLEDYWTWPILV